MGTLKDGIYNFLVRKNENVCYEYERYVRENIKEHYESHLKHWKILFKLKWHYQVKKKSEPLIYWNHQVAIKAQEIKKKVVSKSSVKKSEKSRDPLFAYIDGPESEAFKRTYVQHIVKKYLGFDVISFDIFDTLILRPFANPSDLFYLLEAELGQREFHKIRMECEKKAREKALLNRGNREVTIWDIYSEIEEITGISKEEGVRKEFELEKRLCFANPYMKRVIDILHSYGKPIYAVSDMYLPKDMMTELLEACGFSGFCDVIVSCDYNCNKHENGTLYKILLRMIGGKSVIHVGDNWNADIIRAQEQGLDTHFYKGVNAVGKPYRADGMTELVGSGYAGLINAKLHCGIKRYPIHYEYGYVYGGLYVLGFCNYIKEYCRSHKIDKILFLSRDGDIYSKVFEKLGSEMQYEYVYWSRMANIIACISEDRYSFINRVIDGKIVNNVSHTISSLLSSIGLEKLTDYLADYRINPIEPLSKDNGVLLRKLMTEHYEEIIRIYQPKEQRLKAYFEKVIGNAKRVAVVDVGWTGSNVKGLSAKLTSEWRLCESAVGLLAGTVGWNRDITTVYDEEAGIQSYLFSRGNNRAEYDGFVKKNKNMGTILFELFTQAATPSFKEIDENGIFRFDIPEVENYEIIKQIQSGILDFAEDYKKTFGEFRIMMNITGYDAYMPFRKVFRDVAYFKRYFDKMVFAVTMFSDSEMQSMESLGTILQKRGL